MLKAKMLVGLAVMLGTLGAAAAPAFAYWQSLPTKAQATSGTVRVINAGELIAKNAKGEESIVKCPTAGVKAEWKIRSTGKVLEEEKGPLQTPTKRGPHLQFTIKWEETKNGCTTTAGVVKTATNVEECSLQLHQQEGVFTATADVATRCVIKVPGLCEVGIPVAKETAKTNFQLGSISLVNTKENQLDNAGKVTGITDEVTKESIFCPLESNSSSELNGLEFEPEKINAV